MWLGIRVILGVRKRRISVNRVEVYVFFYGLVSWDSVVVDFWMVFLMVGVNVCGFFRLDFLSSRVGFWVRIFFRGDGVNIYEVGEGK